MQIQRWGFSTSEGVFTFLGSLHTCADSSAAVSPQRENVYKLWEKSMFAHMGANRVVLCYPLLNLFFAISRGFRERWRWRRRSNCSLPHRWESFLWSDVCPRWLRFTAARRLWHHLHWRSVQHQQHLPENHCRQQWVYIQRKNLHHSRTQFSTPCRIQLRFSHIIAKLFQRDHDNWRGTMAIPLS